MEINDAYRLWLNKTGEQPELNRELREIADKPAEIEDRFYRDLEFGTAGLRGVLGAGTNRMNVYTVAKATSLGIRLCYWDNGLHKGYGNAMAVFDRRGLKLYDKEAVAGMLLALNEFERR